MEKTVGKRNEGTGAIGGSELVVPPLGFFSKNHFQRHRLITDLILCAHRRLCVQCLTGASLWLRARRGRNYREGCGRNTYAVRGLMTNKNVIQLSNIQSAMQTRFLHSSRDNSLRVSVLEGSLAQLGELRSRPSWRQRLFLAASPTLNAFTAITRES